jgi:hypothetical protein
MQCASTLLSSEACPTVQYPSTLPRTRHNFRRGGGGGKKLLQVKRVLSFSLQTLSETFLILRITEQDMIKNLY